MIINCEISILIEMEDGRDSFDPATLSIRHSRHIHSEAGAQRIFKHGNYDVIFTCGRDNTIVLLVFFFFFQKITKMPTKPQKHIKWIIIDYWCLNWVHLVIKMPNLENLEFYTCTLLDHNAKFLIMAYRRNSWVPNDCILVGINVTKETTFDFMRNDVLQNYLDQFLKCLADNFDNLKFQDASKVAIFRPPNSYILHCHGKCGLFTIYLKGNDMKNSKFGKS